MAEVRIINVEPKYDIVALTGEEFATIREACYVLWKVHKNDVAKRLYDEDLFLYTR